MEKQSQLHCINAGAISHKSKVRKILTTAAWGYNDMELPGNVTLRIWTQPQDRAACGSLTISVYSSYPYQGGGPSLHYESSFSTNGPRTFIEVASQLLVREEGTQREKEKTMQSKKKKERKFPLDKPVIWNSKMHEEI